PTIHITSLPHSSHPPPLLPFPTRRSSDLNPVSIARHCQRYRKGRTDLQASIQQDEFSHRHCLCTTRERPHHRRHRPTRIALSSQDRKSTRLNSSHVAISYAVFCLKKKR